MDCHRRRKRGNLASDARQFSASQSLLSGDKENERAEALPGKAGLSSCATQSWRSSVAGLVPADNTWQKLGDRDLVKGVSLKDNSDMDSRSSQVPASTTRGTGTQGAAVTSEANSAAGLHASATAGASRVSPSSSMASTTASSIASVDGTGARVGQKPVGPATSVADQADGKAPPSDEETLKLEKDRWLGRGVFADGEARARAAVTEGHALSIMWSLGMLGVCESLKGPSGHSLRRSVALYLVGARSSDGKQTKRSYLGTRNYELIVACK